ncbi:hypothetical protein [Streptomyces sp. NPDC005485]|uniref:hypothetical protein n=1 Tax=Streptomyces sp. NPDC005485 TaxID=3155591 RepID=UPI0033ACEBFE
MNRQQLRILVAAALGRIVEPILNDGIEGAEVVLANSPDALRRAVEDRLRFDVVLADLLWNDRRLERNFDGLDVLDTLRELQRSAPAIMAAQGSTMERDLLDEASVRPDVVGVIHKSRGPADLVEAICLASTGRRLPPLRFPTGVDGTKPTLHDYFGSGRRGATCARMAGAIAAGQATDYRSLHQAAHVPLNTANKLVSYLGPLILARGEHPSHLPMNCQAVFRWCGQHEHYILSWCRRYGHPDVTEPTRATGES